MSILKISWSIRNSISQHGGPMIDPSWTDIEKNLEGLKINGGTVTLSHFFDSDSAPRVLQIEADGRNFILTLGGDTGKDYEVKFLQNISASEGQTEILGNHWDSRLVCHDFDLATSIFHEFFKTKKVSNSTLK